MKKQKFSLVIFLVCLLVRNGAYAKDKTFYYTIPEQELALFKLIEFDSGLKRDSAFWSPEDLSENASYRDNYRKKIPAFKISSFITLAEYKEYLKHMKRDSSDAFFKKQLPADKLLAPETWEEYITNPIYEPFPAIGVSWESAMNFCKWKTLRENKQEIDFIYRLALSSEWIAANHYLTNQNADHDFNKKYADWTLASKDESVLFFSSLDEFPLDYIYLHRPDDPPSMIRKFVIGGSYLYSLPQLVSYTKYSYYGNEGYRHIGFRIVCEEIDNSANNKGLAQHIAKYYWNLIVTSHENTPDTIDLDK